MDLRVDLPGTVKMVVYNVLGEKVAQLLNQYEGAGNYRVSWDGTSTNRALVGNAVYLISITQPSGNSVQKSHCPEIIHWEFTVSKKGRTAMESIFPGRGTCTVLVSSTFGSKLRCITG